MSEAVAAPEVTSASAGRRRLDVIQAPVRDALEAMVQTMRELVVTDLPLIGEVSSHLLHVRGKMFRPTLTLLASAADGAPDPRRITIAASIELMHLATLVHDDSVDHSVLRRGLPTVNSLFSHQVAVIMGDFLYTRALTTLVRCGDLEIMQIVADVANELTIGEMRQLAAIDALSFTEADYEALIRAKTASLISGACESGSLCGAARHRERLAFYGDRLGMAFQIADDILDYAEDEATTGKPGGLDLREHKVTLPLLAALPRMSTGGRRRVDDLFATDDPDPGLVHEVVGIVTDAGGLDYARRRGEQFAGEAADALAGIPESPVRAALMEAITYVMERRS